jgi:hypothetical protein
MSAAARAADRAVSGRRAPGIGDDDRREIEEPGQRDLGWARVTALGDGR